MEKLYEDWYDETGKYHKSYRITWRYHLVNKWIESRGKAMPLFESREVGDQGIIRINPKNPKEIFDNRVDGVYLITSGIAGGIIFIVGIVRLVNFLRELGLIH